MGKTIYIYICMNSKKLIPKICMLFKRILKIHKRFISV